jgi:hypothetical protein
VQAGNPTNYLEFVRYLETQGHFPRIIIVGLGVEQVAMSPNHSWLNELLKNIMPVRESNQWMRKIGRVKQLFTIQTTSASFRALRTDAEREPQTYTFDADGLGHFTTTNPLDVEVNTMIQGSWNGFFDQLSVINPLRLEDLHDFLEICRAHDTVVIFYLPPYHSRLLASFEGQPYQQLYNDLMDQLAVWQKEASFTVYDFTDPVTFGGNDQLFVDAIHPSEEAARLMLDIMLHDFEP